MRRTQVFTASAVVVAALTVARADATTRFVATCGDDAWTGLSDVCEAPDGPKATIQAAIDPGADGDTIVILDGTYRGPGNTHLTLGGRSMTVRSADGAEAAVIDGDGVARAFIITDGATLDVDGLTMTGGWTTNGGGAIRVDGGEATIRRCAFVANTAGGSSHSGGALWVSNGAVTVLDCTFEDNVSENRHGGAVHVTTSTGPGEGVFRRCAFKNNAAPTLQGGGISLFGTQETVIAECVFDGNTAAEGGGVGLSESVARISDCVFTENVQSDGEGGGAINCFGRAILTRCEFRRNRGAAGGAIFYGSSSGAVDRCVFFQNEAALGGAIYNLGSKPALTNCLLAENDATLGGAIFNLDGGSPVVIGCTITENDSAAGGAMFSVAERSPADPLLVNSVLWDNGPDEVVDIGLASTLVAYSDIQGGWTGAGFANIDADPLFVKPRGNDWRLGPGSPCIDAGNNEIVPQGVSEDLDGKPRFLDDPNTKDTGNGAPPIIDLGAYEFCSGDLDRSGTVDFDDLLRILDAWGNEGGLEDLDGSGLVDFGDLVIVLEAWGSCG